MGVNIANRVVARFTLVLLFAIGLACRGADAAMLDASVRTSPAGSCYEGNIVDAVELVERAILLMDRLGAFVAFRRMMEPAGGFVRGDLYVFVLNEHGTIVANGNAPESVGTSALPARDQHGVYFVREILQRAYVQGDGWIGYHWFSPCSGRLTPKQVYFRRAGRFVVCAGFYNTLGFH